MVHEEIDSISSLRSFLMSWWSKTYSRPLKDPLLMSYTLEELLYEFYDKIERNKVSIEIMEDESSGINTKSIDDAIKWAEEEEKKDREEWMKKQLEENKKVFGEDFGEDLIIENLEDING